MINFTVGPVMSNEEISTLSSTCIPTFKILSILSDDIFIYLDIYQNLPASLYLISLYYLKIKKEIFF